jgi:hypothetical protein
MLVIRVIYIYIYYSHLYFPHKHYPRALRTKHNLNESNVILQYTWLVKFYTKSIFLRHVTSPVYTC